MSFFGNINGIFRFKIGSYQIIFYFKLSFFFVMALSHSTPMLFKNIK